MKRFNLTDWLCILLIILSWSLAWTALGWSQTVEELHKQVLYPVVRLRIASNTGGGSGTVIHSSKQQGTFVLTNYHVIDEAIKLTEEWDTLQKKKIQKEWRYTVVAEFFKYRELSKEIGREAVDGDVVAYDKAQDIALVKLRVDEPVPYVARLIKPEQADKVFIFQKVYAVGAALGHGPIATNGTIMSKADEIESLNYWLSNAQITFGNSGGAVFLSDTLEYIGMPSRVAVTFVGWSPNIQNHMGFFIPATRIYKWLETTAFRWLIK